jgi:glycosyltransferase involved in cell wall biosynthesis
MIVVLWGTCDTGKPRIRILRDGLQSRGIKIIEIHAPVWEDVEDKSSLRGAGKWLVRALRLLAAYPRLIWRYLRAPAHDLVLVAYPGQLDVLVVRPFAWLRRKPIAFDWFISTYDTVVDDRQLLNRRNPLAWLLWLSEWLAVHAANFTFMDTEAHARRMEALFRLSHDSIGRVWVGAEEQFFRSADSRHVRRDDVLQVLFYGQFIPLHGIGTIVEAARLTRNEPIHWTLIGRGQEAPRIRGMLEPDPLRNLEWIDWVAYQQLPEWIARADICLGIFGASAKAASVIPNKVFQIVAAGRPLVTRDSPAIRELLADHPPCVHLVPANDAQALAEAVRACRRDTGRAPALRCHLHTGKQVDAASIAGQLAAQTATFLHEGDKPA